MSLLASESARPTGTGSLAHRLTGARSLPTSVAPGRFRIPGSPAMLRRLWRGSTSFARRCAAMAGYTPGEQPQGGGFIKLNTNENPYPPSPRVRDGDRRAAPPTTCGSIRIRWPTRCATRRRARYDLPRDCIIAGNGSDDLLAIVMRACIDPGDAVAYPYPTYSLYDTLVEIAGARAVQRAVAGRLRAARRARRHRRARHHRLQPQRAVRDLRRGRRRSPPSRARSAGLLVIDEAYVDFAADSRPAAGPPARQRRRPAHPVEVVLARRHARRSRLRPGAADRRAVQGEGLLQPEPGQHRRRQPPRWRTTTRCARTSRASPRRAPA